MSIFNDRSPVEPVSQHFFTWGIYETVVQNAATNPTSVSSVNIPAQCRHAGRVPSARALSWPGQCGDDRMVDRRRGRPYCVAQRRRPRMNIPVDPKKLIKGALHDWEI